MSNKKYRCLDLNQKVEIIKMHKNKIPVKQIQKHFNCGKTQVYETIKKKEEIKTQWLNSSGTQSKRRKTSYDVIDKIVYEWFLNARSKLFPISGPILQKQAKKVAEALELFEFKASNGWLESFKKRHQIVWKQINKETEEMDENVKEWSKKIEDFTRDYSLEDIYTCAETGIFFRLIPSKSCTVKAEACGGGEHSKERLTLLLCCNMSGEIEKPWVIGKSQRCFNNIETSTLPIIWRANSKSWMTSHIMEEFLVKFNDNMIGQNRKVILFLDNARSHPKIELSNVNLCFFPPNSAWITQPLEQGIIKDFKCHYRKYLLRTLINQSEDAKTITELTKSVTVLDAVMWIGNAVKEILPHTITNCFAKTGFQKIKLEVDGDSDNIPLNELYTLLQQLKQFEINEDEFLTFEDGLAVEDTGFIVDAVQLLHHADSPCQEQEEEDTEDEDDIAEESTVNSLGDAVNYLRQIQIFLSRLNGDSECLMQTFNLRTKLEKLAVEYKTRDYQETIDFLK